MHPHVSCVYVRVSPGWDQPLRCGLGFHKPCYNIRYLHFGEIQPPPIGQVPDLRGFHLPDGAHLLGLLGNLRQERSQVPVVSPRHLVRHHGHADPPIQLSAVDRGSCLSRFGLLSGKDGSLPLERAFVVLARGATLSDITREHRDSGPAVVRLFHVCVRGGQLIFTTVADVDFDHRESYDTEATAAT